MGPTFNRIESLNHYQLIIAASEQQTYLQNMNYQSRNRDETHLGMMMVASGQKQWVLDMSIHMLRLIL
jgi:hypothetical protein